MFAKSKARDQQMAYRHNSTDYIFKGDSWPEGHRGRAGRLNLDIQSLASDVSTGSDGWKMGSGKMDKNQWKPYIPVRKPDFNFTAKFLHDLFPTL